MPDRPVALAVGLLLTLLSVLAGWSALDAHRTPAAAQEACDGVWVVVDARALGGSLSTRCAPGDPANGVAALQQAGFAVAFVPNQPGFVCTIDRRPDPCNMAPADAYWSYWHAPAGGSWAYSNTGAANRNPAPGTVEGWRFGDGNAPPGTAPPAPSPEPTPPPADDGGSAGGSGGSGSSGSSGGGSATSGGSSGSGSSDGTTSGSTGGTSGGGSTSAGSSSGTSDDGGGAATTDADGPDADDDGEPAGDDPDATADDAASADDRDHRRDTANGSSSGDVDPDAFADDSAEAEPGNDDTDETDETGAAGTDTTTDALALRDEAADGGVPGVVLVLALLAVLGGATWWQRRPRAGA